jgi:hypothetical protein
LCGLGDEAGELRHPEILLVERAVDLLHHLLEAVGTHHIAIALHPRDGFGHELPRIALDQLFFAGFNKPRECVVAIVLVAVHHEQIAGRFADADADDVLAVLLELCHEARKIGITGEQNERADLRSREHQLHRIDGQPDIGRVFLGGSVGRCHDHVDRGFGERNDVLGIAAPVGVRALD